MKIPRIKYFFVAMHISVWLVVLILPFLFERPIPPKLEGGMTNVPFSNEANLHIHSIIFNLSLIPIFYFNAYWSVPKILNRRKWPLFLLTSLGLIALAIGFNYLIEPLFIESAFFPYRIVFSLSLFFLLASTAFSLIRLNFIREKVEREAERENLKTELSFLRSQINPHFLFNTLNSFVSLARKNSDVLEESLIRLSGLMHYMLYESDEQKISIYKELEYLQNYTELQKLRFGKSISINYKEKIIENSSFEIAPMILVPFVENAFKHGGTHIENPEIDISIDVAASVFTLFVKNKFDPDSNEEKDIGSGIGLTNVQKRLNLLYPIGGKNRYDLQIYTEDHWHIVQLIFWF